MANRRVTWLDLGLTVALAFFGLTGTGPAAENQGQSAPVLSYVLVLVACLPIAIWRWRPMVTLAVTGAATMLYIGLGYAYGPILITLTVAVYGFAARVAARRAITGLAVLLAVGFAAVGAGVVAGERDWPEFVSVAAWLVIPAAIGAAVKVRRDAAADVRAAQARRAVSEERLQLAQEVHDVVGHGLAVIAMQAGVALRVLDRDPEQVRAALEGIRSTSKDSLDSLRAELEALRRGPDVSAVPLRPIAGLGDLPGLAERIRTSGLPVAVEVAGDVAGSLAGRFGGGVGGVFGGGGELPAEVDRAAYRIVQESLTNVLRHGGPEATARIRITRDAGTVHIEILDTGHGAAAPSRDGGRGIDGMRARAEALGGTLAAGPDPTGGFAVRARLPLGEPA